MTQATQRSGPRRIAALALLGFAITGCAPAPTPAPSATAAVVDATPSAGPTVPPTSAPTSSLVPSPTPTNVAAPLDGLAVDAALAARLPMAVMVDDNKVARPQSGFNAASIVYQAPADGGEDRYMLVFQERDAPDIGPVRSGRPYFVKWAAEYRAGFAHYGGDLKTLANVIPALDGTLIYNLDALAAGVGAFHRISSRPKPHNGYTSTEALWDVAARLGYPSTMVDGLALRPFKDDAAATERPASGSINIPYGTGATSYTYDPATNAYLRSVAGRAQVDAADGQRVVARDVIVLYMTLSVDPESEPGHHRPVLGLIGSGKALVFRDGTLVKGTWKKESSGALTQFFDGSGAEIALNRGRIFIQVVAIGTNVTYRVGG